ncbi:MAG: resolvase [Flavobacteriales bacterium CG18_big_fil_WC_8_21_14_2_50_32_9]|nr:MAG: resolvase [Flavobacteriales bacterium CG18_big_fil_WC_8_21_14_2_50_32_9]
MIFGYARISTKEQNFDLQIDALLKAGVEMKNIYKDVSSGAREERVGLDTILGKLRENDVLLVWKLDRIARSVIHLAKLMENFNKERVHFKSIQEPFLDTTSSHGRFVFTLFSAVAQLERDLIIERTKAGLESARRRGRIGGRAAGLSKEAEKKAIVAEILYKENKLSISEICSSLGLGSKRTLYKYLRHRGVVIGSYGVA